MRSLSARVSNKVGRTSGKFLDSPAFALGRGIHRYSLKSSGAPVFFRKSSKLFINFPLRKTFSKRVLSVHILIVCNALFQFEWAWQHPQKSRAIKAGDTSSRPSPLKSSLVTPSSTNLKRASRHLNSAAQVVLLMLNIAPWCRWPLAIYFVSEEASKIVAAGVKGGKFNPIPTWCPVNYGSLEDMNVSASNVDVLGLEERETATECYFCSEVFRPNSSHARCGASMSCKFAAHFVCAAGYFIFMETTANQSSEARLLLPVSCKCPLCLVTQRWTNLSKTSLEQM